MLPKKAVVAAAPCSKVPLSDGSESKEPPRVRLVLGIQKWRGDRPVKDNPWCP